MADPDGYDVPDDEFVGQDPDPEKRAQNRERVMGMACPSCDKTLREHSKEELRSCAAKAREQRQRRGVDPVNRERVMGTACPSCGKTLREHSTEEWLACGVRWREQKPREIAD